MAKPVAIVGPNTMCGFASDKDAPYSEFKVPDYLSPELKGNYNAARVALWFRSWNDAQEFVNNLQASLDAQIKE